MNTIRLKLTSLAWCIALAVLAIVNPASAQDSKVKLKVGDVAPLVTGLDQDGKEWKLAAAAGKNVVLLYFYPKDETPGCTMEACSFRDAYEDFVEAGAVVVGVSGDSLAQHEAFASHHRLPFKLISDEDGALRKAYQVPTSMFGLVPGRVTFVIDREGVIRHVFNSQVQARRHVKEALDIVKSLSR